MNNTSYTQISGRVPQTSQELIYENQNLRLLINKIASKQNYNNQANENVQYIQQNVKNPNLDIVLKRNQERINELQNIINNKKLIINQYKKQFSELEQNIKNVRLLDQDIYARLNSPNHNSFYNQVNEFKKALNCNVPYQTLLQMLEQIR